MSLQRHLVLCADDFGMTDGVSRGILDLMEQGRLSATSVMTNMPGWRRAEQDLRPYAGRIGIGLHLNLTTGTPIQPMSHVAPGGRFQPIGALISNAFRGRLSVSEIAEEIRRQLVAFEGVHEAPPDFVDGHQHVHVLPVIRQALFTVLQEKGYAGRVWLRDPSDRVTSILRRPISRGKALIITALARGFRDQARAAGFDTNDGFSGFSPLDPQTEVQRLFGTSLANLGPRPVVMCHPGYVDDELRSLDPAVESRPAELAYLQSEAFGELLEERGIVLAPAPQAMLRS
ncbi:ChbG/HpnK family deacetylase [Microvirga puerhi]|uniref:ChbG/HpnK family deacetylase n=1 Tax=Microvirga puerhi TaxID=2876078 RepID=A0ABS7VMK2_9HYPH|nr:ChbG/HpnK family deacetylase [Microvirga puerhi]MBZ6076360.1 ChbG/HpnK family deacetylase [Microvirga puerhi]